VPQLFPVCGKNAAVSGRGKMSNHTRGYLLGAALVVGLMLGAPTSRSLQIGPAAAFADCTTVDEVLYNCRDKVFEAAKNMFRYKGDAEKAQSNYDTTKNCLQCATSSGVVSPPSIASKDVDEPSGSEISRIPLESANYRVDIENNGTSAKVSVLDNEGLSKIAPRLASLKPPLQTLNLSGTRVSDLEPLKVLTALQELDLSFTQVSSLEPLRGLAALRWLNLTSTRVLNLEPLRFTALSTLILTRTRVWSFEAVYDLPSLKPEKIYGISDDLRAGLVTYRKKMHLPY
jgi:hypothetical protein